MKVVIVGSGMAGVGLAEELRRQAPDAEVALVTRDTLGFYSRPSLSHSFSDDEKVRRIVIKMFSALGTGIEVRAGAEALSISRPARQLEVADADGRREQLAYDHLVLATGSEAVVPPAWSGGREHFFVLNRLEDMQAMRALRERVATAGLPAIHWAIVGGGLIGLELASDLRKAGDAVSVYHAGDQLMERTLDVETSKRMLVHLRGQGIEVLLNQRVDGFAPAADGAVTVTAAGGSRTFGAAVVAIGFRPRTDLAAAAGLVVRRGIVCDRCFATEDSAIRAVGDAAEVDGTLYPFVVPIVSQAKHLALLLSGKNDAEWTAPSFPIRVKIHGFR